MPQLSEHVVYHVAEPVSLASGQAACVPIGSFAIRGEKVLGMHTLRLQDVARWSLCSRSSFLVLVCAVYDPKVSQTCASRCVHLTNTTTTVLAPGTVSVSEDGRLVSQTPFTPMLPADDQLIGYGDDSTLSINRTVEATSTVKTSSLYWRTAADGRRRRHLAGARQTHVETKTTTYTIKNNATSSTSDATTSGAGGGAATSSAPAALYIDHEADVSHGGYVIRTKERAIKSTSSGAFTRYRFVLAPQEEVTFTVEEDAQHYTTHTRAEAVRTVLNVERDAAVLSAADRKVLEDFVARTERRDRLRKVEEQLRGGGAVPERTRHGWRTSDALPKALLNALDALHALNAKRSDGGRQKGALQARIEEVFTNQNRLRENIRAFEKIGSNELLTRYLSDMCARPSDLTADLTAVPSLPPSLPLELS